jgi:diketogulonate reductase-like aldo/keto reductase
MVNTMFQNPKVMLNNGMQMPLIGLGAYAMHGSEAETAILNALEIGYRLIDTAAMYGNEVEVGNAIRKSKIPRREIFVTTKVADHDQGYESTLKAFDASFKKLNVEYIDLYLVHWPVKGKRRDTWKALEKLYSEKKVKAIGVANYLIPFLEEMKTYANTLPVVNQVEFTPYVFSRELVDYCANAGIQLQAYSPIARGHKNNDPKLKTLAEKYHKTPAQIFLKWCVQHNVSPIPKSVNVKRLKENIDIFDFEISEKDMALMDTFNENYRVAPDPIYML